MPFFPAFPALRTPEDSADLLKSVQNLKRAPATGKSCPDSNRSSNGSVVLVHNPLSFVCSVRSESRSPKFVREGTGERIQICGYPRGQPDPDPLATSRGRRTDPRLTCQRQWIPFETSIPIRFGFPRSCRGCPHPYQRSPSPSRRQRQASALRHVPALATDPGALRTLLVARTSGAARSQSSKPAEPPRHQRLSKHVISAATP